MTPRVPRRRVLRWLRLIAGVITVTCAVYWLWLKWTDYSNNLLPQAQTTIDTTSAVTFILLMLVFLLSRLRLWTEQLRHWGCDPSWRDAAISCFVPQLGKYLPGKVWGILAQVAFVRKQESGATGTAGAGVFVIATMLIDVLGALPFAIVAGAVWWFESLTALPVGALAAAAVTSLIVTSGRFIVERALKGRALYRAARLLFDGRMLCRSVGCWCLYASANMLLFRVLIGEDANCDQLLLAACAGPTSWMIGFLCVVAPGGLGVREVVVVTLLEPMMGAKALIFAAITRTVWSLWDLILGVGAICLWQLNRVPNTQAE